MDARAAVLTCGSETIVTHHAALALRGVRPLTAGPIDVTLVGRRVRRDGIRAHDVAALHRSDVSRLRGILVSTTARALLEVACELSAEELDLRRRAGAGQAPSHQA